MSSAKLRCFQHYLFESNHFLCVVTKLHFWRSLLPKTCFGFFCNYIGSSELYITKKQQFGFIVAKCAAWSFIASRICFTSLTTTLSFLELYITKKKRFWFFCFLLLKHVGISYIREKAYFGLFAAKLCCCQRYCTWEKFSSSLQQNYPGFYFILLKTTFLLVSG